MLLKIFKEPLVQFFLSGFVLYFIYNIMSDTKTQVTQTRMKKVVLVSKNLLVESNKTLPLGLSSLEKILAYNQVLLEEAYFLELYKQDKKIKDILLHKMELLLNEKRVKEPTEKELFSFYNEHKNEYGNIKSITFALLDVGNLPREEVKELRLRLNLFEIKPQDIKMQTLDVATLPKEYGKYFTHITLRTMSGLWSQPTITKNSTFLVYIKEKKNRGLRTFEDVESQVYQDYMYMKKLELQQEAYQQIAKHYKIEVR